MIDLEAMREKLIKNHIINRNGKRCSLYKTLLKKDESLLKEWIDFSKNYREEREAWFCISKNINPPKCPICGELCKLGEKKYNTTCEKCSANSVDKKIDSFKKTFSKRTKYDNDVSFRVRKITCLKKYGDANYSLYGSTSFKKTMEKKYGDASYNNHKKAESTNMTKYGAKSNLCFQNGSKESWTKNHDNILSKREETSLKKYGTKNPCQSKNVIDKIALSKRENIEKLEKENNAINFKKALKEYGQGWLSLNIPTLKIDGYTFISNEFIDKIKNYHPEHLYSSKEENDLASYIKSIYPDCIQNDRATVSNRNGKFYELDIYVPSKKVAFEFDGSYWHSSIYKDSNYHIRKSDYCREDGIRLIHIDEDLWNSKKDIYKSIIASSLGIYKEKIYARKCSFREIDNKTFFDFVEKNHIAGGINANIRYGLFYNNELVQVVGFGKSRFEKNKLELYRMCSKLNTQVVGGFSKLIKDSKINNFISYVNLSIYNGDGYMASGFKIIGKTNPGYFYIKDGVRYNRMNFQKNLLSKKLDKYDDSLTEQENMLENDYLQVYNCGDLKVEYKGVINDK